MKKASLLSIAIIIVLAGCGGTQYRSSSRAKGSQEWGPKEIKSTSEKMVESIYSYFKEDWKRPAYVELRRIRNKSDEHIDTQLLADEIVTQLVKKRIRFVSRKHTAAAIKEMEMGMTGLIDMDSAIPMGNMKSPNFYLSGDIRSNTRLVGNKNHQYIKVNLYLYKLATGELVWQDSQEFYKVSRDKKISF